MLPAFSLPILTSFPVGEQHEDLLNLVLGVLRSWNDPLIHLASEVQRIKEAPDTILWKAVEIEEQNKRLLEGMERIVGRVSIRSITSFQPVAVRKTHTVIGPPSLKQGTVNVKEKKGTKIAESENFPAFFFQLSFLLLSCNF